MTAFTGFNERKDHAEHITTRSISETAGHLLAVFDLTQITLAHVVIKWDVKAPDGEIPGQPFAVSPAL